jgi:hypothetical protein
MAWFDYHVRNDEHKTLSELFKPERSAVNGAASGAYEGCVATSEVGCYEGAVVGGFWGTLSGLMEGAADTIYDAIDDYVQAKGEANQDIQNCRNEQ